MRNVFAILGVIAVVGSFASVLMALSGPVRSFSNPNVACGSNAVLDGGYNLADAGATVDGGYQIDPITASGMAKVVVENNSTEPVYIGGSDVQPGSNVLAVCTAAATCSDSRIEIEAESGSLYCTASTETTVRALSGGY